MGKKKKYTFKFSPEAVKAQMRRKTSKTSKKKPMTDVPVTGNVVITKKKSQPVLLKEHSFYGDNGGLNQVHGGSVQSGAFQQASAIASGDIHPPPGPPPRRAKGSGHPALIARRSKATYSFVDAASYGPMSSSIPAGRSSVSEHPLGPPQVHSSIRGSTSYATFSKSDPLSTTVQTQNSGQFTFGQGQKAEFTFGSVDQLQLDAEAKRLSAVHNRPITRAQLREAALVQKRWAGLKKQAPSPPGADAVATTGTVAAAAPTTAVVATTTAVAAAASATTLIVTNSKNRHRSSSSSSSDSDSETHSKVTAAKTSGSTDAVSAVSVKTDATAYENIHENAKGATVINLYENHAIKAAAAAAAAAAPPPPPVSEPVIASTGSKERHRSDSVSDSDSQHLYLKPSKHSMATSGVSLGIGNSGHERVVESTHRSTNIYENHSIVDSPSPEASVTQITLTNDSPKAEKSSVYRTTLTVSLGSGDEPHSSDSERNASDTEIQPKSSLSDHSPERVRASSPSPPSSRSLSHGGDSLNKLTDALLDVVVQSHMQITGESHSRTDSSDIHNEMGPGGIPVETRKKSNSVGSSHSSLEDHSDGEKRKSKQKAKKSKKKSGFKFSRKSKSLEITASSPPPPNTPASAEAMSPFILQAAPEAVQSANVVIESGKSSKNKGKKTKKQAPVIPQQTVEQTKPTPVQNQSGGGGGWYSLSATGVFKKATHREESLEDDVFEASTHQPDDVMVKSTKVSKKDKKKAEKEAKKKNKEQKKSESDETGNMTMLTLEGVTLQSEDSDSSATNSHAPSAKDAKHEKKANKKKSKFSLRRNISKDSSDEDGHSDRSYESASTLGADEMASQKHVKEKKATKSATVTTKTKQSKTVAVTKTKTTKSSKKTKSQVIETNSKDPTTMQIDAVLADLQADGSDIDIDLETAKLAASHPKFARMRQKKQTHIALSETELAPLPSTPETALLNFKSAKVDASETIGFDESGIIKIAMDKEAYMENIAHRSSSDSDHSDREEVVLDEPGGLRFISGTATSYH